MTVLLKRQKEIKEKVEELISLADNLHLISVIRTVELKKNIRIFVGYDKTLKDHKSVIVKAADTKVPEFYILLPKKLMDSTGRERDTLRFLIGHELGHLYLHIHDDSIIEIPETPDQTQEANLFALEILKVRGVPTKRKKLPNNFLNLITCDLINGHVTQENISNILSRYCKEGS